MIVITESMIQKMNAAQIKSVQKILGYGETEEATKRFLLGLAGSKESCFPEERVNYDEMYKVVQVIHYLLEVEVIKIM